MALVSLTIRKHLRIKGEKRVNLALGFGGSVTLGLLYRRASWQEYIAERNRLPPEP